MPNNRSMALVTGANRGIGLEVVRQLSLQGHDVLLASRDLERGQDAARHIAAVGEVRCVALDVADFSRADDLLHSLQSEGIEVDILVNNAGINYDDDEDALNADWQVIVDAMNTNALGAWRLAQAFAPGMAARGYGRIVNVSSEAGSLASMSGSAPAYSVSKAAMNAITRVLAGKLRRSGVLVNSVCPGWTATDMGGGGRPVAEGAAGVVWAATLADDGPTGGFFRDGKPIPW